MEYEQKMPSMEEMKKKANCVGSRISHYEWSASDYDRNHGKGAFYKKYPETQKLVESLYDEKVSLDNTVTKLLMESDFSEKKETTSPDSEANEIGHY